MRVPICSAAVRRLRRELQKIFSKTKGNILEKINGQLCKVCGLLILAEEVEDHVTSKECAHELFEQEQAKKTDWVCLDEEGLERQGILVQTSIKNTKDVPYSICPNETCVWTPKWVDDAIKYFLSMEGFSGLNVTEYLTKMAINQTSPGTGVAPPPGTAGP
jgi:hypothetical protein